MSKRTARKHTATKVLASMALVAGAAGVAGLGTFGEFTDSTTASQQTDAGYVELTNNEAVTLSDKVTGMVPGDTIDRALTLTRADRSEKFGKVSLAVSSDDATNPLVGGANYTNGLQLIVESCSKAWTPVADDAKALECAGGTEAIVLPAGSVLRTADLDSAVSDQLNTTKNSYLRVRLSLPKVPNVSDNALQGKSATLQFAFTAHQRTGQAL